MSDCCHFCGYAPVLADSPIGGATCADCRPIRDHVVSMQTGEGGRPLAVCQCGWRYQVKSASGVWVFRDVAVRRHWREMILRAAKAVQS